MWCPLALLLLILPGWETYKWRCRGSGRKSCEILVMTAGSGHTVERDRVTIRDEQKNRVFPVTMKILRRSDTDTYWCGIERTGTDLGAQVEVIVYPEPTTIVTAVPGTADTASPGTTDTAVPRKVQTTVPGKRNTAAPGTADTAVRR
nr:CMRF35-like molecule 1 isoform X2 [Aotus nancymaae]